MRKSIIGILTVIASVVLVATFAGAQPGIGITKTAPLSGRGSSGDPFKIDVCLSGSGYVSNGTSFACGVAGDITGVTTAASSGLSGGCTSATCAITMLATCSTNQILKWSGAAWACAADDSGTGDITGVTVTSPACSAGSFVATLTGGASTGDAPVGGTCVAEVGDISTVTTTANMGLTGGGTSGAVSVGLLSTCANGQVLVAGGTGTTWTCGSAGGESTIAGAGLTLTGSTVDLIGSSDFSVGADLLDLSTAVTAPGTLTTVGLLTAAGGGVYLTTDNTVGFGGNTNASATGYFSYYGYAPAGVPGVTQFRDTVFGNGKGAAIMTLAGSTATLQVAGSGGLTVTNTSTLTGLVTATAGVTTPANLTTTGTGALVVAGTAAVTGLSTLSGGYNSSAGTSTVGDFRGTVISPSTTGTLNDYAPTGIGTATVIDFAPTGSIDLLGLTTGALGRIITIRNANNIGYLLVIYDEGGTSVAANRFDLNGDTHWTLRAGDSMTFVYTAASRWAQIGHSGRQFPGIWTTGDLSMGGASITGALNITGTGTVATGALTATGNTTLGDAITDTVTITGNTTMAGTSVTLGQATGTVHVTSKDTAQRPTLSAGCGTGAALVGNDHSWVLTTGTGPASCVITWNTAYGAGYGCTVSPRDGTFKAYTLATTTLTFASVTASSKYDGDCQDH